MLRTSWIVWTIANIFWFVLFLSVALFLWFRTVDGTGAVQTPELKLFAITVWAAFFIIPVVIQIIWCLINIVVSQKTKKRAS